jgi:hypothetical protein
MDGGCDIGSFNYLQVTYVGRCCDVIQGGV